MKLLLDTQAFIWWDSDPARLSAPALAAIRDPANEVWLSVATVWEMVIKAQLGKLTLRLPLADVISQQQAGPLYGCSGFEDSAAFPDAELGRSAALPQGRSHVTAMRRSGAAFGARHAGRDPARSPAQALGIS